VKTAAYSVATLAKEDESREQLVSALPSSITAFGPVKLPSHPDIDWLIVDNVSSALLICELKWIRKPLLPLERIRADGEFLKGVKQLCEIKKYLTDNPAYLKSRGMTRVAINEFKNVHYLLIARDHFLWVPPTDSIALLEFEVFRNMTANAGSLEAGVSELLRYEWLPKEGRDFVVRPRTATSNGAIATSELFFPPGIA
jgi:hypothetical protein